MCVTKNSHLLGFGFLIETKIQNEEVGENEEEQNESTNFESLYKHYFLDVREIYSENQEAEKKSKIEIMKILVQIFSSDRIKIAVNIQATLESIFRNFWEIDTITKINDPLISCWLRFPDNSTKFDDVLFEYLKINKIDENSFASSDEIYEEIFKIFYFDLKNSIRLYDEIMVKLSVEEFDWLDSSEMEISIILARMGLRGIQVEYERLKGFQASTESYLTRLQEKAREHLKMPNLNLSKRTEMSKILFDDLKLPKKATHKTKTGSAYSTSMECLKSLVHLHPLPQILIDHRQITNLHGNLGTLCDIVPDESGRISATWTQTSSTGRIQCHAPNLQTLARSPTVLSFPEEQIEINVRDCFCARENYHFVSADYTQLEVRILAHFSEDPTLINYLNSGNDVHKLVASHWLAKPVDSISSEERNRAKTICYGTYSFSSIPALSFPSTPLSSPSFIAFVCFPSFLSFPSRHFCASSLPLYVVPFSLNPPIITVSSFLSF